MFGSNDDKKTPGAPGEKKGLFGWLRKKPQQPVVEQPETQAPEPSEPTPVVVPEVPAAVAPLALSLIHI